MRFYHGSLTDNIEELSTKHSNGKIYFTSSRLVALTYLSKSFPNMFRSNRNVEVYDEVVEGLFKSVTQGQSGFIYTIDIQEDFNKLPQDNNCGHQHCFYSTQNAKIVNKKKVKDLYQELLKYQKSGKFKVITPQEISEQKRKLMIENICKVYNSLEKPLKNKRDFMYMLLKKD